MPLHGMATALSGLIGICVGLVHLVVFRITRILIGVGTIVLCGVGYRQDLLEDF